jgi:redox-sensitive bicupin YhaK (pirin superfamily)
METNHRRSFFKKLGSSLVATVGVVTGVNSLQTKSDMQIEEQQKPILEIKPMGFIWDTYDPFLFCVHHEDKFPVGNGEMGPEPQHLEGRSIGDDFIIRDGWRMYHGATVPGFPGHPHRGFETITVVREGFVDHSDSMGASGRYGEGDVQWMTAGRGVQHAEMFPLIHEDQENPMELFQIWLNLPKKSKMVDPHFKMLWSKDIPRYQVQVGEQKGVEVEVIAGEIENHKAPSPAPNSWAADPQNEVAIFNVKIEPGATFILPKALLGINRTIYFYQGEKLKIGDQTITKYNLAKVRSEMTLEIENISNIDAKILVLQGKPINEPVMQYGPFVMNTKEEIHQAFDEFNKTRFGGWPWPSYDVVHDKNTGRFAKYADGTFEAGS